MMNFEKIDKAKNQLPEGLQIAKWVAEGFPSEGSPQRIIIS